MFKDASAYRRLQVRVHPDKHPQDSLKATRIFKEVKIFYDASLAVGHTFGGTKRTTSSSIALPVDFEVTKNKWSHVVFHMPYYEAAHSEAMVARLVAYQCINARGAIAHGKRPSKVYSNTHALTKIRDESKEKAVETIKRYEKYIEKSEELSFTRGTRYHVTKKH